MQKKYILSFDIGTTSTRALLFDKHFSIIASEQKEIKQYYPHESWVEQNPDELFESSITVAEKLLKVHNINPEEIAGIGITNQRETTILWDKKSGKPIYNAIVWQDKRTSEICKQLKDEGYAEVIKDKTGLQIDPYFSATKIKWIIDNVEEAMQKAITGELLFGTVDTYFMWRISGGKTHATDVSNASRTMIFNIEKLCWDKDLLNLFNIPEQLLPSVLPSSGFVGETDKKFLGGISIPITGIAGDQQAALFGQSCFEKGMTKNTYGTGCFILMNCGEQAVRSENGLITTIAWKINGKVFYALEGSVFIAGSLIKWLRDELGLIKEAKETEQIAINTNDESEVFFVPCFSGLGAPYWDMNARGIVTGLSLSTTRAQIIKAGLESLAYQTKDVIEAMQKDAGTKIKQLNVDGGAAVNNYLMQFQADMLDTVVIRPEITESTALGAALLAGIGSGFCTMDDFKSIRKIDCIFNPEMLEKRRNLLYGKWLKAVEKARG